MNLDAELLALVAEDVLPTDLIRRLLQHPETRRSVALLHRDLTEELIAEINALGSIRTLAVNSSAPAEIRAPWPSIRRRRSGWRRSQRAQPTTRPAFWPAWRTIRIVPSETSPR
ncbi:hypothetical protein NRF20_44955 [Streptomyces sp. R-74717]|uniref:hypothetical protein n=1 Tax=Streptomyces TaxID=1883 RepID=UPI00379AA62A